MVPGDGKAQSAMEYLMTYGWAILIIAVVLGALYILGLFSAVNYMPRVQPGSCSVQRPFGAGNSKLTLLAGNCDNELPEYVAQFNGQSSRVSVPNPLSGYLTAFEGASSICFSNGVWVCGTSALSLKTWQFVSVINSPSAGQLVLYINSNTVYTGANQGSGAFTYTAWIYPAAGQQGDVVGVNSIGARTSNSYWFSGSIADVQVYNASLSNQTVGALYQEGIGGEPISLSNLAAWWPLNGNANDYSGNNDNGVPGGVTFSSGWTGGYTVP
jgi:hypothetical protein